MVAVTLIAAAATAQTSGAQSGPAQGGGQPSAGPRLDIPQNVNFMAARPAQVVARATAIVNDEIITRTDIDQRVALRLFQEQVQAAPQDMEPLRAQILRSLIDEALQIQAAREQDVKIEQKEIDESFARYAQSVGQKDAANFSQYLKSIGSSDRSVKRQILGELSWQQLQRRLIRVSVGDDEVTDILNRLNASRGAPEYHVAEIFIRSTPENAAQVRGQLTQVIDQIRRGANFAAVARQISEATTAARGGDLGWVTAERLTSIAPEIATVVQQMPVGTISDPIQLPGGFSVVALVDSRQILVANPRDAVLSLMQMSIDFPAGTPEATVRQRAEQLARATQAMGGCGGAAQVASTIGADLVSNDAVKVRELPAQMQPMLLQMAVGQVTQPMGSPDRISVLVLCGRDDPQAAAAPTVATIADALEQERMSRQAQRYLRDLRRDAVVEYR